MTSTTIQPTASFLVDIIVVDHPDVEFIADCQYPAAQRAFSETKETGLPAIVSAEGEEQDVVVLSIPTYCDGEIKSVVCFVGSGDDANCGVMEVWQPIGAYDELSMTKGYFGALERFQNVSSYVRFEKGSGLPGQVWRNASFIIHDKLPSHSGFLRAAGASAESLEVAVGIPVLADDFLASVLLISSGVAPLAKGFEVWRSAGEEFLLESAAYQSLDESLCLSIDSKVACDGSLPGMASQTGHPVITDDSAAILFGRNDQATFEGRAFAMPFFEDGRVTNVLVMLL
ncbi:GAF domain-containing protein [Stieleria sp. JC731]|uniref:GAF domain-containing protein n=1 Tax=Pirellulaceae TaxID=2691357 RepID=UPI001E420841|nr:GAF domain-containing protein [Stieleria sp. JC731]MCC9600678.1 GAF domain-containing protein [Stieleria sp. JC731]